MYKFIIRPILFLFSPETAHNITFTIFQILQKIPGGTSLVKWIFGTNSSNQEKELFGIKFKNQVGLAAGLDKNAEAIDMFAALGFGFVEIGTVTPKPQSGNPKPRLFRLKKDHSLINRMGFNNGGVELVKENLKNRKSDVIVGGNIGKNKITPNDEAVNDYLFCFHELFDLVDYFVVNVSSPNTPGLRELQEKKPLTNILNRLMEANSQKDIQKPILLKIAPDLSHDQLDDIVDIVFETKISGLIATNTTIDRSNLLTPPKQVEEIGNGGLSGAAIADKSTDIINYINEKAKGKIVIIGVGGILSGQDAQDKINVGASLVQVFSGFIYEGPGLISKIIKTLA